MRLSKRKRASMTIFSGIVLGVALLSCVPGDELAAPRVESSASPLEGTSPEPEAVSLLGEPLYPPDLSAERRAELEQNLQDARADFRAEPESEDAAVWVGRRLAYLGRYRQAIEVYSRGLEDHPDSYKLLRHRGHRYITLRRFDEAVADLERAGSLAEGREDEVEPDGIPNALGVPLSTVQFNIWYHLGLAHYLNGDYQRALDAYRKCLEVSTNPDLLVATSDWMYMTLRRLGQDQDARALLSDISADLEIVENSAYHRRLLMYRGEIEPEELLVLDSDAPDGEAVRDRALELATQGYGVANWYLAEEDRDRAFEIFEQIVEGSSWAAFGYIAAEADLARAREDPA